MIKMMALGDSIFAGWDGTKQVPDYQRIPEVIGKINGWYVNNQAVGGTGYGNSNNDFSVLTSRINFADYSLVLISYGVNNWISDNSLDVVRQGLTAGINNIKRSNPHARPYVMLPTLDLRRGRQTTLDTPNGAGMTQNMLSDGIMEVCDQQNIDFYDWRKRPIITKDNAFWTLGDGATGVHLTAATSIEMGKILAKKLNGGI